MCHLSSVFSFASSTDFRDNHWVQFKRWITDTFFTSRSRRPMFIIISKPNPFNLRLTVSDSAINKQTNKQRKTVSKLKKKNYVEQLFRFECENSLSFNTGPVDFQHGICTLCIPPSNDVCVCLDRYLYIVQRKWIFNNDSIKSH